MSSTFSADTKDALARIVPESAKARATLREGLALYGSPDGNVFRTQRAAVARLYLSLLEERQEHHMRKVPGKRLLRTPVYEIDLPNGNAPKRKPGARAERRLEMRAAFLACGSVAEPSRGYHLEFVPPSQAAAERLTELLREDGHEPKLGMRKKRPVVYFKGIDAIVGVLTAAGAFNAVLHLEDVRALKETKNRIRRLVNTEAANVDRAAGAAAVQRDLIAFVDDVYGLRKLSPHLREIADLRLRHPTETLAELGLRCRPPAKKSTVNGRLTALSRLAQRLR